MTKSEIKREQKLNRILAAACKLFASADLHQVCMEEIAERAGVGKGTLYNMFESKEDLYFSIIRTRLAELITLLERTYQERDEPLRNLRSLIVHLHKFMEKHHYFYLIWKREESSINGSEHHGDIRQLQDRIDSLIFRVLESGAAHGILRSGLDHRLVERLFLGMVDSLRKDPERVFDREPEIDALFEILMSGIGTIGVDTQVRYDRRRHHPAVGERSDG